MENILGDKTILSLLEIVDMEQGKKQELIALLPAMDEVDRRDIFQILYQLFAIETDNKIALEEAKMLAKKSENSNSFDWKEFEKIEEKVLKELLQKKKKPA